MEPRRLLDSVTSVVCLSMQVDEGSGSAASAPRVVTAVIAGAQRCGTTSLARLLEQHPDVCLARDKEAHWFDDPAVQRSGVDKARFADRFSRCGAARILLDATPSYLYLPGCIEALHRHNPDAKMIAILRDPAERAHSQYAHEFKRGELKVPYWRALMQEEARLQGESNPLANGSAARVASLRDRGRYSRQVAHLLEWYPDALVLRFDELIDDAEITVRRITDHLGLEPFAALPQLPWLNGRQVELRPTLLDHVVRWTLRKDMRATEDLLGWDRGVLTTARLGRRWKRRPGSRARGGAV